MADPSGKRARVARGIAEWAWLLLALCVVAPATLAVQLIPPGGKIFVSSGKVDLACTDLTVDGLLDIGSGTYVNVRNVTVGPSGEIDGAGSINYSGALSSSGTIQPGVQLIVNPPTNPVCPGPGTAEEIPTLGNAMLVALAMLLLWPAGLALRGRRALRRRNGSNGADR